MKFSKKKFAIDSIIYTLLPKVSVVAALLILPWITPYLTLEDYGIYGLLMAYITLFQIVIVLGQNILIQNAFFTHKANYKLVWRRSFAIMTIAGILSSLIFIIILQTTMLDKVGVNSYPIMVLVSIYLILSPIDTIIVTYYVLHEKSLPYAIGAGITGLITTLVTLITIKYLRLGYMGWIISLPITVLMSYIYFFKRIFFTERLIPQFRLKKNFLMKAIKIGLPLTPHQLSLYILGTSDRILLEYFNVPIKRIGFYSQGYNLGTQGNIVINGIFQALSKKIQEGFRGEGETHKILIKRMIVIVPILISAILFLGSIWMKEVFYFLFRTPELRGAYPVSIIVLNSYMFWSIYTFFTYPLLIKNQTFSISKISLAAAFFNIAGNIILIPHYGIWAALGVTYVSYIIFGFAGLLNKDNRDFLSTYINISKVSVYLFLFNVALFLIAFLTRDFNVLYKFCLTAFFISGLYYSFKKYTTTPYEVFNL